MLVPVRVEGGESEKMSERLLLVWASTGDEGGDGGVEGGVIVMALLRID